MVNRFRVTQLSLVTSGCVVHCYLTKMIMIYQISLSATLSCSWQSIFDKKCYFGTAGVATAGVCELARGADLRSV